MEISKRNFNVSQHSMMTRMQARLENTDEEKAEKRIAIEKLTDQPRKKRPAFSDITNAISSVVIDSTKKKICKIKPQQNCRLPLKRSTRLSENSLVIKEITTKNDNSFFVDSKIGGSASSNSSKDASLLDSSPNSVVKMVIDEDELDDCEGYDFDKENSSDLFLVPDYAWDIFLYYKSRESKFQIGDYMQIQPHLSRKMRAVLADWMEQFELNHETLYMAVKLTDIYLSNVPNVEEESLQLIASAAIFISSKFDERSPPFIDDFLYVCQDAYTSKQLIDMEMCLLHSLDYDISMPISYRFLRRYSKTSKMDMSTLTLARYILETSLMFYEFAGISDSLMGAASFLLALRMKNLGDWTPIHRKYSGYNKEQVEPLMWKLNHMMEKRPIIYANQNAVHLKYSHDIFFNVARIALLTGGPDQSTPIGPPLPHS